MLDRVAGDLRKVVSPVSKALVYIGTAAIIFVVLLVTTDVLARRIFSAPLTGVLELSQLAFSMIVFLSLAWAAIKGVHVELDFLVKKFPKKVRLSIEVVMTFLTIIILGLMSWRILVQGTVLQSSHSATWLLKVPVYPFVYIAAFGSLILTLAFFVKFIQSISDVTKE